MKGCSPQRAQRAQRKLYVGTNCLSSAFPALQPISLLPLSASSVLSVVNIDVK